MLRVESDASLFYTGIFVTKNFALILRFQTSKNAGYIYSFCNICICQCKEAQYFFMKCHFNEFNRGLASVKRKWQLHAILS